MSFKDWFFGTLIGLGVVLIGAACVAFIFYLMGWIVK